MVNASRVLCRVICLLLIFAAAGLAQTVPPVDRLPADTLFYVVWRGSASLDRARATNSLLRLWNDPEFAPFREAWAQRALASMTKDDKGKGMTRKDLDDVLLLLENPALVAWVGTPDLGASSKTKDTKPGGGFLAMLDITGKSDTYHALGKRVLARQGGTVTTYEFGKTTIEKQETTKTNSLGVAEKSTSYSAVVGNFALDSDQKELLEKMITRLEGAAVPVDSIVKDNTHHAATQFAGDGAAVEFFLRIPDLTKMDYPPTAGVDVKAILRAIHVERMHALTASLNLTGTTTRVRMGLLGDTTPGSLFDFFGASQPAFATLAATPTTASYSAFRFDLVALFQTVRVGLKAGLPPEQAGSIELMEGGISTQMNMTLPDLLALLSGEFAIITTGTDTNLTESSMFALKISKPEEVLRLARMLFGGSITSEDSEGEVTYLAVAMPYTDPKTGAQRKRFYYAGVSPQVMVFGPRKVQVKEAVARMAASGPAPAGTLGADAQFQRVRAQLPPALSGLSYTDMTKYPWGTFLETLFKELQSKPAQEGSSPNTQTIQGLPQLLAKYLHTVAGGWWKDRNGVFSESFVE